MQPEIELIQSKKLVGIYMEMSLVENNTGALFSKFMPNRTQIKNTFGPDIYEVMVYDTNYFNNFKPIKRFTKWGALEVVNFDALPEGMSSFELNGGLHAVFNYRGLSQDFGELMQYIMMTWLPASKYTLDDRPHFNVLGEKYKKNDPNSEEMVYIPIKTIGK